MIVKLTSEQIGLVGATSSEDFAAKLVAYVSAAKQIEKVMAEQPDFKTLESRIATLETAIKGIPTADSIKTSVTEAIASALPAAMNAWAGSESGKKLIGAEASRITAEALAAVGTTPAKPSPAPADQPAQPKKTFAQIVQDKISAGMTKLAAITATVSSNPAEYQEYLKVGGPI